MPPTVEQLVAWLELHGPTTCGLVSEPYRNAWQVPQSALPAGYVGPRSLGNVFYFLVTPQARVQLHRIRSDQMYHHYLGAPLEALLFHVDGRAVVERVGGDFAAGERPQLFIPGGTFHTARVASGGEYALLGTSVWLRAESADVEVGNFDDLVVQYPGACDVITSCRF